MLEQVPVSIDSFGALSVCQLGRYRVDATRYKHSQRKDVITGGPHVERPLRVDVIKPANS